MILRPPRDDDVGAIVGLLNATAEAAFGTPDMTEAEFRRWLTTPDVDAARDIRVAEEDGRIVGYADVDPTDTEPVRWWCVVRAHPDGDAGAVVPQLLAWAETRAGSGILRVWAPTPATDLKAAFEAAGMRLIRHSYRMQIDLDAEPEPPVWPDGIGVRTFEPADARAVYEAHQETFEDSWEHAREPYDKWSHWLLDSEGFDPGLWYLAEDGDDLAGILLSMPKEAEPDMGLVHILGVRRPWRGRGVGRALLQHAFREFRRRGFASAVLGVDASSLTGANRLYEAAGMRVVRQFDFFEKTL